MDYTEQEILSQFGSCRQTIEYMLNRQIEICDVFSGAKRIVFTGAGSSFCVAKSAEKILKLRMGIDTMVIAAGDLLLNYEKYKTYLDGSHIVCLSRSGNTSELLLSVKRIIADLNVVCISICMQKDSELAKLCSLNLTLDWAFDRSVCQTQSVTNLYLACAMLTAIISDDLSIAEDFRKVAGNGMYFYQCNDALYHEIADKEWNSVAVLADCEIAGLAEEGALAFKEISRIQSNHYHLMDVRHGPIVNIDGHTLVVLVADEVNQYVLDLVKDIKNKGAIVLTMSMCDETLGGDMHIYHSNTQSIIAAALYMIFSVQMIALYKAKNLNYNPDLPEGLDACIRFN